MACLGLGPAAGSGCVADGKKPRDFPIAAEQHEGSPFPSLPLPPQAPRVTNRLHLLGGESVGYAPRGA